MLAKIHTTQDIAQGLWGLFDPLGDILTVGDTTVEEQGRDVLEELFFKIRMIHDDETLDGHALDEHVDDVKQRLRLLPVVLRDHATDNDPRVIVGVVQDGVEHLTADVFIINVDPLRAVLGQVVIDRALLVVEGRVKADGFQIVDLFIASCRTHDVETQGLAELTHQLTDRAGRSRDIQRLTSLGLANLM